MGQAYQGNFQVAGARVCLPLVEVNRVLLGDTYIPVIRYHAQHGFAGAVPEVLYRRLQKGDVAAELVDYHAFNEFPFVFFQQFQCTYQRSEHASAVDIPDHQDGSTGHFGDSHIDYFPLFEVYLRRTPRALDDDDIVGGAEAFEGLRYRFQKRRSVFIIVPGGNRPGDFPQYDDLAAGIGGRLEKHRVHVHRGGDSRRLRLHHLRPSDFPALGGDVRIKRHVLRLERGNFVSFLPEDAAEGGYHDALPRRGGRPLNHESPGFFHTYISF